MWNDEPEINLSSGEKSKLAAQWRAAAQPKELPAGAGAAQALAAGVNFRINFDQGF